MVHGHLPYEITMLCGAYDRLQRQSMDTVIDNALIESFAVHAMNLVRFFETTAYDYVTTGYVPPPYVGIPSVIIRKIRDQILTLTSARTIVQTEKFGQVDWVLVREALMKAYEHFQTHLNAGVA